MEGLNDEVRRTVALDELADQLDAQARELYRKAEEIRAQHQISASVSVSKDGKSFITLKVGGTVHSIHAHGTADETCQKLYYLIQGYQPPLRLPPFGTRLDETEPSLCKRLAFFESVQTQ
ncbi:hypothetical protein F6S08_18445 [Pseudomonas sp. JV449]|uniref:hypothetical protein n=1 Tax=Pseudomonas sp. JV449 TaxID=1890658 RepID=UPI0028E141C4|nr:hypothetical protein [Pseudomonas sp. JV449]MDT9633197.1 hypothetical protein [Pseudomonas sp. JV449]